MIVLLIVARLLNLFQITVGDGKFNVIQDRNGKVCLCINRITEADIGYYTCRAANSEGEIRRSIRLVEAGKFLHEC